MNSCDARHTEQQCYYVMIELIKHLNISNFQIQTWSIDVLILYVLIIFVKRERSHLGQMLIDM